jgi:hypothetical protein
MNFAATGKRAEDIVILQHHNRTPCLKCLAIKAPNDPSPLLTEMRSHTMAVEPPAREITSRHRFDRRSLSPLAARRYAVAACATECVEDWHRAIPRRHENYTHRLLEKFVQRCDQ